MATMNPVTGMPVGNAGSPVVNAPPAPSAATAGMNTAPNQQMTAGVQNRNEAFSQGMLPASQGMQMAQLRQRMAIPRQFTPTSTNQQIMPSANGMGTQDASRQLMGGAQIQSPNGMASDTYQMKRPFLSTTMSRPA